MSGWAVSAAIGFVAAVLSGVFGVGGGIITTPAIRLLLSAPALIAVGTPLPVIIPSAATGAIQYMRHGMADVRTGLKVGLAGALTAVVGALAATRVGGSVVLIGTAVLITYAAADMVLQTVRPPAPREVEPDVVGSGLKTPLAIAIGVTAGLYSGFFGLGGGFVLVPLLSRWAKMPMKRAIGTSLVAVTLLAIPGTLTHWYAGNVDWSIALWMMLGVVPGALLGVRITLGTADRVLRVAFATLLVGVAIWLAVSEAGGWM